MRPPLRGGPVASPGVVDPPAFETVGRGQGGAESRSHGRHRRVLEWTVLVVIALSLGWAMKTYVVQQYTIPSGSMEPTLEPGDHVVVDKLSYHMHSVHRGDVVVFAKPPGDIAPGITDLIKRVIGLPGETVQGIGGAVYVDGHRLAEPWLPTRVTTAPFPATVVPPGDYFMMGDNRGDSADSRVIGSVPGRLIVGRAVARIWPPSRWGGL